jgi:hypothetical protein
MIAGDYGQQSRETIPLFYLVRKIILSLSDPSACEATSPSQFVCWIQLFPKEDLFLCLFAQFFGPKFVLEPSLAAPDCVLVQSLNKKVGRMLSTLFRQQDKPSPVQGPPSGTPISPSLRRQLYPKKHGGRHCCCPLHAAENELKFRGGF